MRRRIWWIWPGLLTAVWLLTGCQPRTLLSEPFDQDNADRWFNEGDAVGRTTITGGKLYAQIDQPGVLQFATLRQPLVRDFIVQVETTQLSGSPGSSYGILFRKQENGGFYRFEISGDGKYIVERRSPDGAWARLTPNRRWEYSPHILTGLGATNRLRIAASGRTLIFSVNDRQLFREEAFDDAYGAGTLGLSAGTYLAGGLQVAFDNFLLQEP